MLDVAIRLGVGQQAELRCGGQDHPSGIHQRDACTPQLACCWILRGRGTVTYDGIAHVLEPGDAFQRLPGRVHAVRMPEPTTWLFVAIPAGCHAALRQVAPATADLPVLPVGTGASLRRRWQGLVVRLRRQPASSLVVALGELFSLITELHRLATPASHDDWATAACELLTSDDLPLPTVASRLGLSTSAFRARFAAALGVPPRTWRIQQRIARAQTMLANPQADLGVVAEQLGYPDLPTFAKQFRAVVGTPPGRWRQGVG